MAQNQEVRRHSYLTALPLEIEKKLQRVASPSHRLNSLQELFADVALEVDDRAQGLQHSHVTMMCSLIILRKCPRMEKYLLEGVALVETRLSKISLQDENSGLTP
ncbi:hypothetical protein AKJ16_DCAP22218 [Drosera capensis]